jgi:hypothetical protein
LVRSAARRTRAKLAALEQSRGRSCAALLPQKKIGVKKMRIEQILENPSVSNWLKTALVSALDRDPEDVAHDARLLSLVLSANAENVLKANNYDFMR